MLRALVSIVFLALAFPAFADDKCLNLPDLFKDVNKTIAEGGKISSKVVELEWLEKERPPLSDEWLKLYGRDLLGDSVDTSQFTKADKYQQTGCEKFGDAEFQFAIVRSSPTELEMAVTTEAFVRGMIAALREAQKPPVLEKPAKVVGKTKTFHAKPGESIRDQIARAIAETLADGLQQAGQAIFEELATNAEIRKVLADAMEAKLQEEIDKLPKILEDMRVVFHKRSDGLLVITYTNKFGEPKLGQYRAKTVAHFRWGKELPEDKPSAEVSDLQMRVDKLKAAN